MVNNCLLIIAILFFIICVVQNIILIRLFRNGYQWEKTARLSNIVIDNYSYGKTLSSYFLANKITKVGLIGYNYYTTVFYREIKKAGPEVVFCFDLGYLNGPSPIFGLEFVNTEKLEHFCQSVDVLIDMKGIDRNLKRSPESEYLLGKYNNKIVDLEELVYYTCETYGKEMNFIKGI